MQKMFGRMKLSATQVLTNPNARAILILTTLVIAILAGGAPHDVGGG
jgi:hypothetical protein